MEMTTKKTELAAVGREENKKGNDATTGNGRDEAIDKDLNYKGVGLLNVE